MTAKSVYFRTLTPLWTGGIVGNSGQTKETGLIGSLRWWYEGLLRGLGIDACDPGERHCEGLDHCAVCDLFGCTGWSRRFRLVAEGLKPLPLFFMSYRSIYASNGNWLIRLYPGGGSDRGRPPKFHFSGAQALWADRFSLRIIPTRGNSARICDQISFLLHLIANYGGLGAKTQNGFGQVLIEDSLPVDSIGRSRALIFQNAEKFKSLPRTPNHFSLDRFFSTTYEIKDPAPYSGMELIGHPPADFNFKNHFIPCAFDIRYKSRTYNPRTRRGQNFGLRPFFMTRFGRTITNALLGETCPRGDEDRTASRIHVSHLYKESSRAPFALKVWGHLQSGLHWQEQELSILNVINAIDEFITAPNGMFPGSRLIRRFDPKEVLL